MAASHAPATILVVDDEPALVELVQGYLEREGFRVVAADRGEEALRLARAEEPDLMLLDLMLPGLDGLQVCRRLREDPATARLPIIMLTAKAEEVDRVVGLEVGADDYVIKPFSPRELMARVLAVLRRTREPEGSPVRRIGALELDEGRHRVTVAGALVELTAKEFALLRALVRANGR
jgi:DNA-binding response OmpR family regulator